MKPKFQSYFLLLFLFFGINFYSQQRIHVIPNGSNTANGLSWANAVNIQRAFTLIDGNDEMWIRRGTYSINQTLEIEWGESQNRIYGGFAGNETALNQRNWTANPTILDGNNTISIMLVEGDETRIDGITFRKGRNATTGLVGGAITIMGGNSTVVNCTFNNNYSNTRGGAVYSFISSGRLNLTNCTFRNNEAADMGGAYSSFVTNTYFTRCTFEYNTSPRGGALANHEGIYDIRNSIFTENTVGGAIDIFSGQDLIIEGSTFVRNQSDGSGGAIDFNGNLTSRINRTIFSANSATFSGGAIDNSGGLKITNSIFDNNTSSNSGGAIHSRELIEVANSTFVNNTNGAIVFLEGSETKIFNSIFHQNTPLNFNGANPDISINATWANYNNLSLEVRRNILQNTPDGGTVGGNLVGTNPMFISPTGGDYRLQISSPAINYGLNALYNQVSPVNAASSIDLDGNPRVFGTSIDLGAYELQRNPTSPACTTTSTPANGATNVAIGTNISWNSVSGATSYILQIGT
uniref:choice-of-anchor Q domain-containing protein n=1 Tax=Kaistella sp. TaxID=2782235 RepID=UPI002F93D0B3